MAPVYILKSINSLGLVEPIRYLLAYGNIQYENIVICDAELVKIQKVIPFGRLPILEVDGKVLVDVLAISKYLAKIVGLLSLPVNDLELAELDAIVNVIYELGLQVVNWQEQVNLELKNIIGKELIEVLIPRLLLDLEDILTKKGGFLGGKKLSWADIVVVGILESLELIMNKSLLSKSVLFQQLLVEVQSIPAIKLYISNRPSLKI